MAPCLWALLFAIVLFKALSTLPVPIPDVEIQDMFNWARAQGATGLDDVHPAYFNKSGQMVRGLMGMRKCTANYTLLSLPKSILLYAEHPSVIESPTSRAGKEKILGAYPIHAVLYLATARRLVDLGKPSPFAPYIRTLPSLEEFASFHILYADEEVLDMFSALPILQWVRDINGTLAQWWGHFGAAWVSLAEEAGAQNLAFLDIKWALTVILTRAYHATWSAGGFVCVPISDLCNTALSANIAWPKDDADVDGFWNITVTADIEEGVELTESYQSTIPKDNAVMLVLYGFMQPGQQQGAASSARPRCKSPKTRSRRASTWGRLASHREAAFRWSE